METADETDFSCFAAPLASHGVQDPGPPTYSGSYQQPTTTVTDYKNQALQEFQSFRTATSFACCDEVPSFPWSGILGEGHLSHRESFPGRQRDRWARALSRAYEDAGDAQAKTPLRTRRTHLAVALPEGSGRAINRGVLGISRALFYIRGIHIPRGLPPPLECGIIKIINPWLNLLNGSTKNMGSPELTWR